MTAACTPEYAYGGVRGDIWYSFSTGFEISVQYEYEVG